jgi:hypothetical protein
MHCSEDPMVRPRNERNVARAIDGARYDVVNGMATTLTENFAETTTCDPAHRSSGRHAGRA